MNNNKLVTTPTLPIIDLHCDLLAYLAKVEGAKPDDVHEVGCALPHLREGNVGLQIMAMYSAGGENPYELTRAMVTWFSRLVSEYADVVTPVRSADDVEKHLRSSKTGMIAAIENASGLCGEDEPLDLAFRRLDEVREAVGRILYVSLTHHGENRLGGGNTSDKGITADGKTLLEYIDGKGIAVDLSHTSDALAYDIINYIDKKTLDLRIIASHSNFRPVFDHKRNLPDELARIIIERKGLIGMNLLRAFLHPSDPSYLARHIEHGLKLGGKDALCFGADFFHTRSHPDQTRVPFFVKEHENAGRYPGILASLSGSFSREEIEGLAYKNAAVFIRQLL